MSEHALRAGSRDEDPVEFSPRDSPGPPDEPAPDELVGSDFEPSPRAEPEVHSGTDEQEEGAEEENEEHGVAEDG